MSQTYEAQDREFAVASGDKIDVAPGRNEFDGPPVQSTGLVVTARPDDPTPGRFDPGDSYDLTFSNNGDPVILTGATVLRSDPGPAGTGLVVFGGVDQNGIERHVIWVPGVDVEQWYQDNTAGGSNVGFYNSDLDPAYTYQTFCFAATTRIDTPHGRVRVGALRPGDLVQTIDRGAQPVRQIWRRRSIGRGRAAPVQIDCGALGATASLRLSPQHAVLLRLPRAELLFGAAEVLVPAGALVGLAGVRWAPCAGITYVHLLLDHHALVLAEGVICETLRLVPEEHGVDDGMLPMQAARPILTWSEAQVLLRWPSAAPASPLQQRELATVLSRNIRSI